MKTTIQKEKAIAEKMGIPKQTLSQVKKTLQQCAKQGSDATMARLMLKIGRLEDDAIEYVKSYTAKSA